MAVIPTARIAARRSRGVAAVLWLAVALIALPLSAAEAEPEAPVLRGWEPALMLGFGVHSQELRGSQGADFTETSPGRQGKLRFSFSEAEAVLYTPTLTETLGLRFFVHGGGQFPFTQSQLAENGRESFDFDKAPVDYARFCPPPPDDEPGRTTPNFDAGSGFCDVRVRNEIIINGSLFAGLGFDITLPFASYQFHFRPSLNWFGQSAKGESETLRSTNLSQSFTCRSNSEFRDGFRCNDPTRNENNVDQLDTYDLAFNQTDRISSKSGDRWIHGLGPRVELDIEVAKVGNMVFEFFAQVGIYWLLTDRSIEHSAYGSIGDGRCTQITSEFLDPDFDVPNYCSQKVEGGQPIRGFYRTDVGPYIVQGGGGFRVVWKGFSL